MASLVATTVNGALTFAAGSSGTLGSRTGYTDFLGYNATYGSYIAGGASNAARALYAGGYFYDGSAFRTLYHTGNITPVSNPVDGHLDLYGASTLQAIGFNRDVSSGAIYNSSVFAYQIHSNASQFQIQRYNGSGTFLGYGLVINTGGNVGMGTETPYRNAHIYQAADGNNYEGALQVGGNSASLGGYFGYNSTSSGRLTISSLNNAGGANAKVYLGFGLDTDGSPAKEVMTLTQEGKVIIGGNAPTKTFEVKYASSSTNVTGEGLNGGGAGTGLLIFNTQESNSVYANLDFRARNADGRIAYQYQTATNVGDFHFITDNTGSPQSMMTIRNNGNVGINRTSPFGKLDIASNDLGSSSGDVSVASRSSCSMSNTMYLLEEYVRTSAGSNWTTAGVRLQAKTDSTYQGYIQFNGDSNNYGISFGAGAGGTSSPGTTAERMRINSDGLVGIGQAPTANFGTLQVYATGNHTNEQNAAFTIGDNATGGMRIYGGVNNSGNYSFIGSVESGTAYRPLALQPNGSNVGIGSTAPPTKFHVLGNTGHAQVVNIKSTLATGGCYMQFTNASAELGYFGWGSAANNDLYIVNYGGSNTGNINIYAGSATRLTVGSNGNVNINDGNFTIASGHLLYLDGGVDTYIYEDTANSISIATNSTIRMTLSHNGVGINVAPDGALKVKSSGDGTNVLNLVDSSGDALFNVRQSGNDGLVRVYKDGGVQTAQIHTDGRTYFNGGSVGMGTATPGTQLDVNQTAGDNTYPLKIRGNIDNNGGFTGITFGYEGDTRSYEKARIMVEGTTGNVQPNMHFLLQSQANSTSATKGDSKLTILNGGSVGIGTATPANLLNLYGGTDISPTSGGAGQFMVQGNGYKTFLAMDSQAAYFGHNSSARELVFMTNETARLSITGSGAATFSSTLIASGGFYGNGSGLTSLNGSNISSGTVAAARLGSGSSITTKFLRGDNTWQTVSGGGGDTVSITTSAADILSVSSGAISAVDAGSGDRIVFWDNGSNKLAYLDNGDGLSFSGTNLVVTDRVKRIYKGSTSSGTYVSPDSSGYLSFYEGTGIALSFSGSSITFSSSTGSDYRLKKNISTFNSEAWTKVKGVNLRKFDFDEDAFKAAVASPDREITEEPKNYKDNVGFIAHELAEVGIQGSVIGDKDAVDEDGNFIYQKVNYIALVPVLWGALKEAISKIETLESKVQALEDK